MARVGWVVADTLTRHRRPFWSLPAPVKMRVANVARWLNRNEPRLRNEPYRRGRRYDAVVFFKTMDERAQVEADRIRAYGGKVVFDANVNYYEIEGEYDIKTMRPTREQQRDAVAMTEAADWVVADSTNLLDVVRRHNDRASWIPDNVDVRRYRPPRARRRDVGPLRLVWSGISWKAQPFLHVRDALAAVDGCELVLVSEQRPAVVDALGEALPTRYVRFRERLYPRLLRGCDVIVSPKRMQNAYERGHTEWKITLGMACGLPAVASPQQSYVEAISHAGGGILADGTDEWREALTRLRDDTTLRRDLGERAVRTVLERYATPVVARAYGDLLISLV